jgi:hypothetical protein
VHIHHGWTYIIATDQRWKDMAMHGHAGGSEMGVPPTTTNLGPRVLDGPTDMIRTRMMNGHQSTRRKKTLRSRFGTWPSATTTFNIYLHNTAEFSAIFILETILTKSSPVYTHYRFLFSSSQLSKSIWSTLEQPLAFPVLTMRDRRPPIPPQAPSRPHLRPSWNGY